MYHKTRKCLNIVAEEPHQFKVIMLCCNETAQVLFLSKFALFPYYMNHITFCRVLNLLRKLQKLFSQLNNAIQLQILVCQTQLTNYETQSGVNSANGKRIKVVALSVEKETEKKRSRYRKNGCVQRVWL